MASREPDSLQQRVQTRGKEGDQRKKISYDSEYMDEIKGAKKLYSILLGENERYLAIKKQREEAHNIEALEAEVNNAKLSEAEHEAAIIELNEARKKVTAEALNVCLQYAQNLNKRGTALERSENIKRAKEAIEEKKKQEKDAFDIEYANATGPERKRLKSERIRQLREAQKEEDALREQQRKLDNTESMKSFRAVQSGMQNIVKGDFKRGVGSILAGAASFSLKDIVENLSKETAAARENLEKKEAEFAEMNDLNPQNAKKREEELHNYRKELQKAEAKEFGAKAAEALVDIVNQIGSDYEKAFSEAENFLTSYGAHFNARMQGTEDTFKKMTDLVTTNLSISPYVSTRKVLEAIKNASDEGIAYNLEQRAFLSEIADKVANTFDAFDSNLTRLIRLQQSDSTAARLGMEAILTKFFNSMYEDTSYLNKGGLADAVAGALLDAESQLSRAAATEFEYAVQKWLGSLSSLGMSDQAITNIAQGINYLATGDVTSLASNTSLQTLFAMSANRAGLSYAELLTSGLNASNTNKLLQSMVQYLKEIAENSDNQVVKGAYGNIFNMSLSDLKAISNLTENEISTIAGNSVSFDSMNTELVNQFNQIKNRTALPEKLSNVYNNAMYGLASDMANNPVTWAVTKMLNFAESLNTDISIPFISAAGFGLDLNTTILGLVRTAKGITTILGLADTILNGIQSARAGFGLDLSKWGGTDTTARGGVGNLLSSIIGGISGSQATYRTNFNKQDTTDQSLAQATEDSKSTKKITNKGFEEDEDDAKAATKATVAASSQKGSGNSWFWVRDVLFDLVYDSSHHALTVIDTPMKNFLTDVIGTSRITTAEGSVKTTLTNSDTALKVIVQSYPVQQIPVRVVNSSEMAPKSSVSISGGNVSIDPNTLIKSIQVALGFVNEKGQVAENTLSKFIDNAVGMEGLTVKSNTSQALNVRIDSANPGATV